MEQFISEINSSIYNPFPTGKVTKALMPQKIKQLTLHAEDYFSSGGRTHPRFYNLVSVGINRFPNHVHSDFLTL